MPKPFTHIIVKYPSKDTDLLYRAVDGLAMACRIGTRVLVGEDPNPAKLETRNFLDVTFAEMKLRDLAAADVPALHAWSIDYRDGESKIVKPNGQLVSTGGVLAN